MELRYSDKLFRFYPIPNKMFLYTLGEQLKSIQGAIIEVSGRQSKICGKLIMFTLMISSLRGLSLWHCLESTNSHPCGLITCEC
jgi:hypothetical protein